MATTSNAENLRLRVFAGPNGSGKSTIIQAVQAATVKGKTIDLGYYINADDIAVSLKTNMFSFKKYKLIPDVNEIFDFARSSGLLNNLLTPEALSENLQLVNNKIHLADNTYVEHIAQLLARYLRECMLKFKQKFSFETVFSHPSNLNIMRSAAAQGYKVYLYFVSTESPEINKFRVKFRVTQKGHDVPEKKIEERYYRSLQLLYDAAQIAYQCYFFDNSLQDQPYRLINHFKKTGEKKKWDFLNQKDFTIWFKKYYWDKESSILE